MTLAQKLARQQEIINKAKAEGQRALSTEEQREFDELQTDIDAMRSASNNHLPSKEDNSRAIEAERERAAEITTLCREFGIESDEYIRGGQSVDEVRKFILEKEMKARKPQSSGVQMGMDERDKFRDAASQGLALRVGVGIGKLVEGSNELRNLSLKELAKESLRLEGVENAYRLSEDDLLRQHLTPTSLFTNIIDMTARQVFEKAYTEAQTTYQEWTKRGTLTDFRPTKAYQVGTAGELLLVPETGELKHDNPNGAEGPTRQLLTFGRQFSMSRQAFINDDVSFIETLPAMYAQSARLGINRLVYQTLAKNPAIWDGKTLFHKDHGNLAPTGGVPSVATLSEARRLLRKQKAAGGDVNLNIPARFMLVPTSLETSAGQLVGSQVDPSQANPNIQNPFYNQFTVISDAELDDASVNGEKEWYVTADKLRSPIQVDFLNGQDMPTIVMKQAPAGQLGFIWDIYMDYGVTVVDYRTAVKNSGQ
ncbi:phage major capsid protein [Psychrobacillus sp. FSL K6-1267]|uniref:phage major capsid protein n=1 Tax=Psychrobacillus sp. FSL K6-1267 TaxID=2921543 RepID=UPI0030F4F2A9